ncbi:MAG: EAL domain-containing protein [Rhizobiaceae bacterium]
MFGHGLKILVLDDDDDDCFLICDAIADIEGGSYDVKTAHTPETAMELIRKNAFHAVLCDYRLGATSGVDFINLVRGQGFNLPIILLTGMEDSSTDNEALEAGAADFISKSALSSAVVDRAIRYSVANAERQRLLSTVLTSVDAAVCVLDHQKAPILWNPSFASFAKMQGGFGTDDAINAFANRLLSAEMVHSVGDRILEKRISNLPDKGLVITLHDVTEHVEALRERERAESRAAHLANHCSLTGLPNRMAFAERIEKEIQRAKSDGSEFYLMNLDLNRFKEINDVYGHNVGDQLLKKVSQQFIGCLKEGDYLARLGGDEFVAIQTKKTANEEIPALAMRFSDSVDEAFEISGSIVRTGVSVGVACYPHHGANAQELLSNADIAMYRAKSEPKSGVHAFNTQLDEAIRERRVIASELKGAVENQSLEVHFQPQACVKTGRICGFESLSRWHHPQFGNISPDIFIPIAEDNGLINEIGHFALQRSCELAMQWPEPVTVSVNISALQIRFTDIVTLVRDTLFQTGLPASRLELEVTESVLIDDFDYAMHVLRGIRNLGVSLAMDDFGTGYSSLSSIISFPFNKLKIDRSFILQLGKQERMATVTKAIIGLGQNLDLKIIAEGVETIEHVEFLKAQGCDEMQGFLLGKAMPQEKVLEYLKTPVFELPESSSIEQLQKRAS